MTFGNVLGICFPVDSFKYGGDLAPDVIPESALLIFCYLSNYKDTLELILFKHFEAVAARISVQWTHFMNQKFGLL